MEKPETFIDNQGREHEWVRVNKDTVFEFKDGTTVPAWIAIGAELQRAIQCGDIGEQCKQ